MTTATTLDQPIPDWMIDLALAACREQDLTGLSAGEAYVLGWQSGWLTALDWTLAQLNTTSTGESA
ncbi:hypothetical protein [Bifidobacterium callimiconis]|uniref:Uncharacterized protein n=1 Tax=Bifidobacterium callimiconis TaxID=2306973 RepID=A0A430FIX4_9BIFI|nr:hypothetical protein [Bifidobacterium callimiconis]RSX52668.1 hypothetical protein D2E23_0396 [Bifidobacterium callimiconis]